MAELHGRIRYDETKLAAEHAQHSAAAKDLVQAHEQILELKRRTRVAVSTVTAVAITPFMRQLSATFSLIAYLTPAYSRHDSGLHVKCWL